MRLMSNKYLALFCALVASAYLGACGDDDDDGDDDVPTIDAGVDASTIDGSVDAGIDAGPDIAGTIAVLDIRVTNDFTGNTPPVPPLAGAAVAVSFFDEATDTGVVQPGASPLGCTVVVYDLETDPPQHPGPEIDEGAVTVTGTASPVGQCNFIAPVGDYVCFPGPAVGLPAGTVMLDAPNPAPPGTSLIVSSTIDWTDQDPVGAQAQVSGFSAANNGVFPVLGVTDSTPGDGDDDHHALLIGKVTAAPDPLAAAGGLQFITGAGPTPAQRDFLNLTGEITISKAAGAHTPAITDFKVTPAGSADPANDIGPLALTTASPKPEAMPLEDPGAAGFTMSCDGAGGSCGSPGAGTGLLTGFTVTGSTTDADVSAVAPFAMPKAVKKFATFTCSSTTGKSVKITQAAWNAVLGTNPTRIETRVIKSQAKLDIIPGTNIVVGHSLVGWTDVPQE